MKIVKKIQPKIIVLTINQDSKVSLISSQAMEFEQGSGTVKFGPVAEIYEFSVCFRITYLMVKSVIFICLTLKLCDLGGDKQGYPQRLCNVY